MVLRNPPPSAASSAPRRLHILLIALIAVGFHFWLARRLGAVQAGLSAALGGGGDGDDDAPGSSAAGGGGSGDDGRDLEGAEWRRLEGVRALLGIGKLWNWCSVGVAAVGIWGLLQDRLPLLRLFVLNGFLSLLLDLLLLALILLLLTVSSPSSSRGLATTLCGALSRSFNLPDLLGLSLEACEDRFDGVMLSALATLAVVQGVRMWAAIQVLGFYTLRASPRMGGRGRIPLHGNSGRSGANGAEGEYDAYDSPVELEGSPGRAWPSRSGSGSGSGKKKRRESYSGRRERSGSTSSLATATGTTTSGSGGRKRDEMRIFLLPRPEDRRGPRPSSGDDHHGPEGTPLLALTASSPTTTSFPPTASSSSSSAFASGSQPPPLPSPGLHDSRRVLVYAPVMVSVSEARSLGATELVLHGPPGARSHLPSPASPSRSGHSTGSSSTASPGTATTRSSRSRSATVTPGSSSSLSLPAAGPLKLDTAAAVGGVSARAGPAPGLARQDSDDLPTPLASVRAQSGPSSSSPSGSGSRGGLDERRVLREEPWVRGG